MKYFDYSRGKRKTGGSYDVIVCGGGPAGCAAAVNAARLGAKTALIEKNGYLGGAAVSQLVTVVLSTNGVDFEGFWLEYASALTFHDGFSGIYESTNPYYPQFSWLRASVDPEQVKRVLQETVCNSGVDLLYYGTVIDVLRQNSSLTGIEVYCRGVRQILEGSYIIDATGDGDIAHLAGCSWNRGDDVELYSQETSMVYRLLGEPGDLNFGKRREKFARKNIKRTNTLDIRDLTKATVEMRKDIWREQDSKKLIATASELGVRTSRIIQGKKTVSNQNAWDMVKSDLSVAKSSWELDVHPVGDEAPDPHLYHSKSKIYAERLDYLLSEKEWFDIPFGALCAKEFKNLLLAGRIVSAGLWAHGSLRIQQTCMATGEAAGVIAALAVDRKVNELEEISATAVEYLNCSRGESLERYQTTKEIRK